MDKISPGTSYEMTQPTRWPFLWASVAVEDSKTLASVCRRAWRRHVDSLNT